MATTKVRFTINFTKEYEVSSARELLEAGSSFVDEAAANLVVHIDDTMNGGMEFVVDKKSAEEHPVTLTAKEIENLFSGDGWSVVDAEVEDKW